MKKYNFKKIDAFATETSGGNPAGMVYLDSRDDITSEEMQRIARELKGFVSEVGYIWQTDNDMYELKYYSSEKEVDFCGHATIGIMYDLIKNNNQLIIKQQIPIITKKGKLEVENKISAEDAVFISSPVPLFSEKKIDPDTIAGALRIQCDEINRRYPVSIINAGLETLIVSIKSIKGILSIAPQFEDLKTFCLQNSIDIITVYTGEVADSDNTYRTRVFAPTFGYLEDPATGSGNSALGYYLIINKLWDGTYMSLEQNGSYDNSNIVKLLGKNKEEDYPRIFFGGSAIVRIEGDYILS